MNNKYKDKEHPSTGQQPGSKIGHGHFKPVVNRLSCSSIRFTWNFVCPFPRKDIKDRGLRCPGSRTTKSLALGARLRPASVRPATPPPAPPHRPAVPRSAHTRPARAVGCLDFGFDNNFLGQNVELSQPNLGNNGAPKSPLTYITLLVMPPPGFPLIHSSDFPDMPCKAAVNQPLVSRSLCSLTLSK